MKRLEGKTAIVTGGAKGIGEAVVRAFVNEGASVVVADMCGPEGESLAQELSQKGSRVLFCKTDVTCASAVERSVKTAVERFGALDILVNNAGIVEKDCLLEDMPEEVWHNVLNVNLNGVFLNCKYALPYLRKSRGCVVNMASTSGLVATKKDPAYCASKTAIIGLTRAIAADYAGAGVRANAVCPTICETPLFQAYISSFPPEEVEEKMRRLGGPGGRPCTPEEVAQTVLFLASPEAGYVNGIAVAVDGGYTAV